jgi:hypothetical protein
VSAWHLDTALIVLGCVLIVTLAIGWRLSWLATRLDRAHGRAERTWAALDAALVRRSHRAMEIAADPRIDPATALLVLDAASQALEEELSQSEREQAESTLGHILSVVELPGIDLEQHRAALARRLHNDAVVTVQSLRRRRGVRLFRLAGHAGEPTAFEVADFDRPGPGDRTRPGTVQPN